MMNKRSGRPTKPPPHFSREGVFAGPFGESLETVRANQPRFRWAFPAKLNYWRRAHSCSQCGKRPMKLEWLYYRSPKWTWAALCGRAGWLTICPDCRHPVDFFVDRMS